MPRTVANSGGGSFKPPAASGLLDWDVNSGQLSANGVDLSEITPVAGVSISLTTGFTRISTKTRGAYIIAIRATANGAPICTVAICKSSTTSSTPSVSVLASVISATSGNFQFQWNSGQGIYVALTSAGDTGFTYEYSIFGN